MIINTGVLQFHYMVSAIICIFGRFRVVIVKIEVSTLCINYNFQLSLCCLVSKLLERPCWFTERFFFELDMANNLTYFM